MARPRPYGECARCGFTYRLDFFQREWTGARYCKKCVDPKPPDTKPPKYKPEGLPRPDAQPQTEPVFGRASKDDL